MDHFFIEIAHYKHYATDKSSLVTGTLHYKSKLAETVKLQSVF